MPEAPSVSMLPRVMRWLYIITLALISMTGCGPEIGDDCTDSLDCAVDGSRFCDDTQPEGYCLILGCRADECPEESVCVRFGLDERSRTFCMKHCEDNGDCRGGYECLEPDPAGDVETAIVDDVPEGSRFCAELVSSE